MKDTILIYVAGNPDAYPLEYYDPDTESYQGVIPRLLAQFSEESAYRIVYYAPGARDQRAQLARNLQVDLLSGYTAGDDLPQDGEPLVLFQADAGGQTESYCLVVTKAAPDGLRDDLQAFFSAVSPQTVTGLLLADAAAAPPAPSALTWGLGGAALLLAVLTAAAALTIRRYRRQLRALRFELEHDKNTGLGNLSHLQRYYRQFVNDKNRILYHLLYFYVDLEHLHRMAGGRESEETMRYCAAVLQEHTAETDILVKASAEGFVLLKLSETQEQLYPWIDTVLRKIRAYPQTCANPFEVPIAVGIYSLHMGDRDLKEMIFKAGQQARAAQKARQDCAVFSDKALQRLNLEHKLRTTMEQAMKHAEFQLYMQFYVDAHTGRIVGGEALSRWLHPERGLLPPGEFVPVLEQEGLAYQLDYQCLRSCCDFLQQLYGRGIEDFFLSCNFSRETFAAADFVQQCTKIIDGYAFPRELLIFELTESTPVKHLAPIRDNMLALKQYGVRIALDDFGEGFTSFADLQTYPVDGIKLDKGLIDHVLTRTGRSILRAMIQVGHEMDLTILAEGVETEAQAQALRELHCDVFQGFRFYAPIPRAEAMDKLLGPKRAAYPG